MSVNYSASFSDSLLNSSTNSSLPLQSHCLMVRPFFLIFTAYTITNILLLLPLCILILYHGLYRWQQQRSSKTSVMTHSDSFTYHLVTMEISFVFGCIICCCGIYMNCFQILKVGTYFLSFTWFGETFFQPLTCVEHYLAVVHPITYLSLRKERWIRIRNVIIGCIWLLCFGGMRLVIIGNISLMVQLCALISAIIIISFCSVSVLCVLIHPGPGTQARDRIKVDQSKQRAFYTIMAILIVLLLRCAWNVLLVILYVLNVRNVECVVAICEVWMRIPSTLVLPLLYLQRAGVLACCKNIK